MKKVGIGCAVLLGIAVLAIAGAFFMTGGLITAADEFFATLARGENEAAYAMTAAEFKRQTNKESFEAFVQAIKLNEYESSSWNSRSVNNNLGVIKGSLTMKGGSTLPLEVHFVNEDGGWKVLGIFPRKAGVETTTEPVSE